MNYALKSRSLFAVEELTAHDMHILLDLAHALKRSHYAGQEEPQLRDKNIALLCDDGTRCAHCAFEVAALEQGAHVTFIGPADVQLGAQQSMKDTARVLGRLYDAIEVRSRHPLIVKELAAYAGVPVWHGLTAPYHPTQTLADYMTMQEHCPDRPLSQMRVAYLGDARREVCQSLMQGAATMGMDFRIAAPPTLWPAQQQIDAAQAKARASAARLRCTASAAEAVEAVDFVCTDVWADAHEPEVVRRDRIARLLPYQVNAGLLASSGNPAVKFLHGLPIEGECALHKSLPATRRAGSESLEVSADVFASPASAVDRQIENRLYAIKALLVATLA